MKAAARRTWLTGRGGASALAALLLPVLAGAGLAADADCPEAPPLSKDAAVVDVLDGATVRLSDGRTVRLAGLMPPLAPLDLAPGLPWPQGAAARQALLDLVTDRAVRLADIADTPDRHGRLAARLYGPDGAWIGGALVGAGHLIVAPEGGRACRERLLSLEASARAAGRGVWAAPSAYFARAGDGELRRRAGRYMVVEGRIRSVGAGRRLTFLNFGDDWRKDFTVLLYSSGRGGSATADRKSLSGARIRVRGWLESRGGALIRVNSPDGIERLDPASGS
ncbi:endonuclease YncB(thermonuclease family) [Rhodobium orientis]|uniref:TNase-like domain-containing protein n=1 Tax=Rhodobium orientis TaxID=34017 RepID=A0A327JEM9_9HYPH|nr:thermonuclease family protein [Rhodobium orientis]MBB4305658.1 endonuclease YncB(thermonuclease family) [Rhodobium orientis]MBK5950934.1 hypothetical protein [Rhodobium orientis]RAI23880.1 hypothetical protein CH339_22985 [Rhodobium orientis]